MTQKIKIENYMVNLLTFYSLTCPLYDSSPAHSNLINHSKELDLHKTGCILEHD
jgi:hypothetical protein